MIYLQLIDVKKNILNLVPKTYAKNKGLIVFDLDKDREIARVAMINPFDLSSIEYLRFKLGCRIEAYSTSQASLMAGLSQYQDLVTTTPNTLYPTPSILKPLDLKQIGLSSRNLNLIKSSIKNTHGLILITGPSGAGKTTTIYSILNELNTPKINIMTIEDRIENHLPRVDQKQISSIKTVDFSAELRHMILKKPHVIMISEMTHPEITDLAINSAMNSNLILSSSNTNNAINTISKLIGLGNHNFILASALEMIIAQQLVEKICTVCIESYKINTGIENQINDQLKLIYEKTKNKIRTNDYFYQGRGCSACDFTGLNGQVGIFEVLKINPIMKNLISEDAPIKKIRENAIKTGMITMFEDAFLKSREGIITIDEVLKMAPNLQNF